LRLASLRGRLTSSLLIIAKCLAVYAVLAVGYHFLLEPAAKSSPAANKAVTERVPQPLAAPVPVPAGLATDVLSPAPVKHVRPGVAVAPRAPDAARAFAAGPPKKSEGKISEAKSSEGKSEAKPVSRQVVRTTERRERRSREAAFNPFNVFRPWF
jgi:hypothetical protein